MAEKLTPFDSDGLRVARLCDGWRIDVKRETPRGFRQYGADISTLADDRLLSRVLAALNDQLGRWHIDVTVTPEMVRGHAGALA